MRAVTRSRTRRLTSFITALAMFVSAVLPLHAFAHMMRSAGPGSDYCTTVPGNAPAPGSPATPASAKQCAACCTSTGGAPALLQAPAPSMLVAAPVVPQVHALAVRASPPLPHANARGPPRLA